MVTQKLYRSREDTMIGGVCGGLGEYFSIDATILRLGWVVVTIFSGVAPGFIVYVIALFIIPKKASTEHSLQKTVIEVRGRSNNT
ncbi:PspC domain-containing protein [Candidatus Kaiserbacteria bacterium]|nr:PspC domain-containing protein [Candidatus Kaiserbacteria bacterium]